MHDSVLADTVLSPQLHRRDKSFRFRSTNGNVVGKVVVGRDHLWAAEGRVRGKKDRGAKVILGKTTVSPLTEAKQLG